MKPLCSDVSQERCDSSMDIMMKLDTIMNNTAKEYSNQFGGNMPVYYLKEHPHRSYSYMKKSVYLVLRKKDGNLYDINTLVYVSLHELGHIMCHKMDGNTHGEHWKLVFDRLLKIAVDKGYYNPETTIDSNYPSD